MIIKKAGQKDKGNFILIQKETFPNLNLKKQKRYFNLKLNNKEIFCLFENKRYAGHLCFGKHLISPPFVKSVFIEELAIKKEFRNKGFGTKLIKYLIDYCKKNKIQVIFVSAGDYTKNKALIFYKNLGFKKIGYLKEINPNSDYTCGQIFLGKVLK